MLWPRLATSAVLCVAPLTLVACGDSAPADPRADAPLVQVAVAAPAPQPSRAFSGTIAARVESELGFRVPGKLLARLVDAGQRVRRGQPLMRLDPDDLRLAVRAQDEAVVAARARAGQAADDELRYRNLRGTGAISASAYDQARAAADAANAELKAAQARADVARNASRYAELVADADGVVMETLAEPGQVVGAGQPVLRLARAGRREAVIHLPETLRPRPGSVAQATLFGRDGQPARATLRQLSEAADSGTRTYEARYELDDTLADAPLGATVTVRLADDAPPTRDDLRVPVAALFDAGSGPGVWIVAGEPPAVSWRPVTVRALDADGARLGGGIARGDRVVALGAHLLHDGDRVRVAAATLAAGVRP